MNNLKKKTLALTASAAILFGAGCFDGGSKGGHGNDDPVVPGEKFMTLGDDLTDVGEGILTPSSVISSTYNGKACKNVIFPASSLPADTTLEYYGDGSGNLVRFRVKGTANKVKMDVHDAIVGFDALTGASDVDVENTVAKGDFYTVTATSADADSTAGVKVHTGDKNLNYDYSVEDAVVPPTERIVLTAFNTAATDDVESYKTQTEEISYGIPGTDPYYKENFNTVYFDQSKFVEGQKYIFVGTLTSEGKVKDRVRIPSGLGIKNVDILVKDAIIDIGVTYGTNNLTIDIPATTYTFGGVTYGNVLAPLDKVPVVTIADQYGTDTLVAPLGTKKLISGVLSPTN